MILPVEDSAAVFAEDSEDEFIVADGDDKSDEYPDTAAGDDNDDDNDDGNDGDVG